MQVPLIAGDFEDLLQQTVHVVYDLPIVEVDDTVSVCGIVLRVRYHDDGGALGI